VPKLLYQHVQQEKTVINDQPGIKKLIIFPSKRIISHFIDIKGRIKERNSTGAAIETNKRMNKIQISH